MEITILIIGLAAITCGAAAWIRQATRQLAASRQLRRSQESRRLHRQRRMLEDQRRRRIQQKRIQLLARKLQIALLQLGRCPDFRRAASWAAKASAVPLAFRQRQFHRFRGGFVQHFANRLAQGADREVLMESLTDLVGHLGVAPFEAEYIGVQAETRLPARPERRPPDFGEQIQQLEHEHEERLAAIQNLGLDDESIREQLLETELNRFRDELVRRSDSRPGERPLL